MLKKLSFVTGLLVLLGVALWFAQGNLSSTSNEENQTLLNKLDTEQLARVTLQSDGEQKVELTQDSAGMWHVAGANYEADSQKIQALLLMLLDTKLGEKVTEQAKHHARFHLLHARENNDQWEAEKTGKLLVLNNQAGEPVLELLLGKARQDKPGQYIRYANQPAVFIIGENLPAEPNDEDWLNTTITDFEGDQVKSMELKNDEGTFRFVREKVEDSWQTQGVPENETLNNGTVNTLANALQSLEFENLLPAETPVSQTGRENPAHYVAELFDGRLVKVSVGESKVGADEDYYLAIEMALQEGVTDPALQAQVEAFNQRSAPWLYGVKSWIGERFLKGKEDLIVNNKEQQ